MKKWHKSLTQDKWAKFSTREQVLMIASEILRAKNWLEHKDIETTLNCYERALELIDLTVNNSRINLEQRRRLLQLREALGFVYINKTGAPSLCQVFYNELASLISKDG